MALEGKVERHDETSGCQMLSALIKTSATFIRYGFSYASLNTATAPARVTQGFEVRMS